MAKELIFYSGIYNSSVKSAVESLQQIDKNEDVLVRLNSGGGEVTAGFSFLSVLSERTGEVNGIIDGQAASMAAIWIMFFNNVEANDTSTIMFHKAAYPSWYSPTDDEKASLDRTNKMFEKKVRAKVSGDTPEGKAFLDKLFEKDKRNDVELTAHQAKKLGLISKVRTLKTSAYQGMQMVAMVEEGSEIVAKKSEPTQEVNKTSKSNKNSMEISQEKYDAAIVAAKQEGHEEGKKEGIALGKDAENARIADWNEFADIDAEAVATGIASGNEMTKKDMAHFMKVAQKGEVLASHEDDNADDNSTPSAEAATEEEKKETEQHAAFEAMRGREVKDK